MSVHSYFEKYRPDTSMPKGKDPLGIRFQGPVLQGRMSVQRGVKFSRALPRGIEGDAVLQFHLRVTPEELQAWIDR